MAQFSDLVGKTIVLIRGCEKGSTAIRIECNDGIVFELSHDQEGCEEVMVEDVWGDVSDIIESEILFAEETSYEYRVREEAYFGEQTWTFCKLGTINGWLDIRWWGVSNGYYSTDVGFFEVK